MYKMEKDIRRMIQHSNMTALKAFETTTVVVLKVLINKWLARA